MLKLSIAGRLKQALPKLFDALLPGVCHLCAAHTNSTLCDPCEKSLVKNDPRACSICDLPLLVDAPFCRDCLDKRPSFDQALCAWSYQAPTNILIQNLKDKHEHFWIETLSNPLLKKIRHHYQAELPDLVIPIPIHWSRRLRRGYNQSHLIAHFLCARLELPCQQLLKKIERTPEQKGLNRKQRLRNLKSSFLCRHDLSGIHVALVDDVITTGATAESASHLLKQQGAKQVDIWALARTAKT